jgi:hypothetical protein
VVALLKIRAASETSPGMAPPWSDAWARSAWALERLERVDVWALRGGDSGLRYLWLDLNGVGEAGKVLRVAVT